MRGQGPTAQRPKLGYLLSRPLPSAISEETPSALQFTAVMTIDKLKSPDLQNFWSVDAVGTDANLKSMDSAFLQSYQQSSITQTPEGPYIARFPWKVDKPHLPPTSLFARRELKHS